MDLRLVNEKIRRKLARRIVDGCPRADEIDKFLHDNDDVIQEIAHWIFSDNADPEHRQARQKFKQDLWRVWFKKMCHNYVKKITSNHYMLPKEIEDWLVEKGLSDNQAQ